MKKYKAIQGLRFVAFFFVFLQHAGVLGNYSGAFAVSLFFMISGFCNMINYAKIESKLNLKDCFYFGVKKVEKFYPLYISFEVISFLGVIVFLSKDLGYEIKRLMIKVFLLQSWFVNENFAYAYNAATWFLSTLAFLFFLTIPLVKLIRWIYSKGGIFYFFFLLIGLQCILTLFIQHIGIDASEKQNIIRFFTYIFPPYRLFDYCYGLIIGVLKMYFENSLSCNKTVFIFVMGSIFAIIECVVCSFYQGAFSNDFIFLISNFCFLCIAVWGKGIVFSLLSNRMMVALGNISFELFIVHSIVIRVCSILNNCFCKFIVVLIEFLLTMIVATCFSTLKNKLGVVCKNKGA